MTKILLTIYEDAAFSDPSDLCAVLHSCFLVYESIQPLLFGCALVVLLSLVSLCERGSGVLGGTSLRLWAMSQGVLSVPSVFFVL